MSDSPKKTKPTLESLLKDSQLMSGKDLIKKSKAKEKEIELFQQSAEFEEKNRLTEGAYEVFLIVLMILKTIRRRTYIF